MTKNIFLIILAVAATSCSKKESTEQQTISPEGKKIESINIVRTKINDSISIKNSQNHFEDLSGDHEITFASDNISGFSGNVLFNKMGRDSYDVNGGASSGKNSLKMVGTIKRVSQKHLNFEGMIIQKMNGKSFIRNKKTTFFDEGKGNFWRLQDKVNDEGFVDYIDIKF